jgi:hypothetical protein
MASTQIAAVGQYQACAYRVWQLDSDCSILKTGLTSNAIVGTGVARANMSVELKEGQEVVLGLRIRRAFFDKLLDAAVPSNFDGTAFESQQAWKDAVATSEVRSQWDPDHAPSGAKLPRRAIQLGLRGELLRAFATTELLEVIDMTGFVAQQRVHAAAQRVFGPRCRGDDVVGRQRH